MAKAVVIYYSRTGNTRKMAEFIAEAIKQEGVECDLRDVEEIDSSILLEYMG